MGSQDCLFELLHIASRMEIAGAGRRIAPQRDQLVSRVGEDRQPWPDHVAVTALSADLPFDSTVALRAGGGVSGA